MVHQAQFSGLSSLTNSGAGVECTIEIKNPDENIIAGFDADVEIQTGQYLGVTVVPIESITLEKTGSYVYLYNDEDKTVTKTEIKTGAISDTAYEVTSGLKPGDRIVASPKTDYKEDTFKVKVVDKLDAQSSYNAWYYYRYQLRYYDYRCRYRCKRLYRRPY